MRDPAAMNAAPTEFEPFLTAREVAERLRIAPCTVCATSMTACSPAAGCGLAAAAPCGSAGARSRPRCWSRGDESAARASSHG
jgi:hypothetical protein